MLSNYTNNSMNFAQNMATTYYDALEAALSEVFNQFCWGWDASQSPQAMLTNSETTISKKSIAGDHGLMSKNKSKNEPSSKQSSNSIPKNRKSSLPEVAKNLNMILQMVECNQEVRFTATTKSSRGLHNGTSKRRSRYIGVLGNGTRWQVLINVRGKKKYIGTFGSEKEAAIVHDFYAIGLNGLEANTNFSYDGMTVQDMIMNYFTNENYFMASEFISRV